MLKDYADLLLDTMVARDPSKLPLADRYAATENSVAGSLNMMAGWRTVTAVDRVGQYVVDEPAGQVFVTASLAEGGSSTVFWARLKVVDRQLSELEMYRASSRAQAGFVLHPDEVGTYPNGWTSDIPEGQRASRQELQDLGRAIFDSSLPGPETSPESVLMELGGVVFEDPDYADLMATGQIQPRTTDDKVTLNMGLVPFRPSDPKARVAVVDEDQGIVVAIAVIPGFVSPYVVSGATESCFVPADMIDMHRRTLRPDLFGGRQVLEEMPASSVTCQVVRLHSGQVQGVQLFNSLQGPGGSTPWVPR